MQPAGAGHGPSAAPTITFTAIVSPNAPAGAITNVGVVDYHTFGDPDDPGRDTDDAVVTVIRQPLPSTGAPDLVGVGVLGLLCLVSGAAMIGIDRRRRIVQVR